MKIHYFDPSAWIKRHFQEIGSEAIIRLFRTPLAAACRRLGLVEMIATVSRKCQQESPANAMMNAILDNVRADFDSFRIVAVDEPRIVEATELAIRFHLRTMDAIHLACALSLRTAGEIVMVSSDVELLAAAVQCGLSTVNPARE